MDELGAELDGMVQAGVVHGVDAPADPVPGLEHHHVPPGRGQPFGRGEARDAGSQDDNVGAGHPEPWLLVPQRDDRIEPRGPAGGPDAEEEADQRR